MRERPPADWLSMTGTGLNSVADQARRLYRQRRERNGSLGGELFGEPAWDLLLALYVARCQNRPISTLSASIAAAAPLSATWRWLCYLEEYGLIEFRYRSPDAGSTLMALTEDGFERMTLLLDSFADDDLSEAC
jgi:hypothetical protein